MVIYSFGWSFGHFLIGCKGKMPFKNEEMVISSFLVSGVSF